MTSLRNLGRAAVLAAALALAAPSLPGCSGNGLTLGKVGGRVTYKGQPVRNGTVFFMPDEARGTVGPPAMGILDEDGAFVLSTEQAGDGAIVGTHRVGITGLEVDPLPGEAPPSPEEDPETYLKFKAKGAAAAGAPPKKKAEEVFVDRGGRRFRYLVPKRCGDPQQSGVEWAVRRGSQSLHFDVAEDGTVRINP